MFFSVVEFSCKTFLSLSEYEKGKRSQLGYVETSVEDVCLTSPPLPRVGALHFSWIGVSNYLYPEREKTK